MMKEAIKMEDYENTGRLLLFFVSILVLIMSIGLVSSANWKEDPRSCPNEYNSVTCGNSGNGKLQCGIDSDGNIECFNMTNLVNDTYDPSSNALSEKTHDGGSSAGFLVDCEATHGSEPYCRDTSRQGDYWCNQRGSCDTNNRKTECLTGKFAYESNSAECSTTCQNGYAACTDVNTTKSLSVDDGKTCNVNVDDTEVRTINSSYNTTNDDQADPSNASGDAKDAVFANGCTPGCPGDWIDTDGNLTNGCEVEEGASCTTNGVSGTIQSDGSCVADKKNFTTGDFEEYATTDSEDAMLWFQNMDSDGDLINATNSIGESWRINNDSCIVLKDNETICNKDDLGSGNSSWNLSGSNLFPENTSYNVGIGTNETYGNRLQVSGDINSTGTIYGNNISSNSPLRLQTGGLTRMFFDDSNGNVGIGTENPQEKLSVNGSADFYNNKLFNVTQINEGLDAFNFTRNISVSYSTVNYGKTETVSDFNSGSYSQTSASRDDGSGNLGLGYKNGTNNEFDSSGDLLAYWRFDNDSRGQDPKDYSSVAPGNSFDATNPVGGSSSPNPLNGEDGVFSTNAYRYEEVMHIEISNQYSSNLDDFTVSGWLWKNDWRGSGSETWFSTLDSNNNKLHFEHNDSGYLVVYNDTNKKILSKDVSSNNGWIHFAYTQELNEESGYDVSLYVNGSREDTFAGANLNPMAASSGDSRIGKLLDSPENNWTGNIDEVMISGRALTRNEIQDMYFNGGTSDSDYKYNFRGNYSGSKIDNSNTKNWTKVNIDANVSSHNSVNATFIALDTNGNQQDSQEINVSNGDNNYTLSVSSTEDARLDFKGSSTWENSTWEIKSYEVYSNDSSTSEISQYKFEGSNVEVNGTLNVTGNVTSQTDFCIEGGNCLSDSGSGGYWNLSGGNLFPENTSYNVGIGTDSPSEKLEVNGTANFTGDVYGGNSRLIEGVNSFSLGLQQAPSTGRHFLLSQSEDQPVSGNTTYQSVINIAPGSGSKVPQDYRSSLQITYNGSDSGQTVSDIANFSNEKINFNRNTYFDGNITSGGFVKSKNTFVNRHFQASKNSTVNKRYASVWENISFSNYTEPYSNKGFSPNFSTGDTSNEFVKVGIDSNGTYKISYELHVKDKADALNYTDLAARVKKNENVIIGSQTYDHLYRDSETVDSASDSNPYVNLDNDFIADFNESDQIYLEWNSDDAGIVLSPNATGNTEFSTQNPGVAPALINIEKISNPYNSSSAQ